MKLEKGRGRLEPLSLFLCEEERRVRSEYMLIDIKIEIVLE